MHPGLYSVFQPEITVKSFQPEITVKSLVVTGLLVSVHAAGLCVRFPAFRTFKLLLLGVYRHVSVEYRIAGKHTMTNRTGHSWHDSLKYLILKKII